MGYTHYWTRPAVIDPGEFAQIGVAVTEVVNEYPAGVHGLEVNDEHVLFQGGCETFWFPRVAERFDFLGPDVATDEAWTFCKTRQLPYDRAVVESLKAIKRILGDRLRLESDGGPEVFAE